jgi:hypothetical protein
MNLPITLHDLYIPFHLKGCKSMILYAEKLVKDENKCYPTSYHDATTTYNPSLSTGGTTKEIDGGAVR